MSSTGFSRRAAACALLAVASGAARADIELCNESATLGFTTAVGYFGGDAQDWTSRGWYNTPPGKCKLVRSGPLKKGVLYVYARYAIGYDETGDDLTDLFGYALSEDTSGAIGGAFPLCIASQKFLIVGNARCVSRGYGREGFAEVKTDGAAHVLVELLDGGKISVRARP